MHPFHKMSELFEMCQVPGESLCSECANLLTLPFPGRYSIIKKLKKFKSLKKDNKTYTLAA